MKIVKQIGILITLLSLIIALSVVVTAQEINSVEEGTTQILIGDMNNDGLIKTVDARRLLRVAIGLDEHQYMTIAIAGTGRSAYDLACENGFEGTLEQWLASLVGKEGKKGAQGNPGKSAFEEAIESGYTGTLQDWLYSLVGPQGADGKSAYEIAVDCGYKGTPAQWIKSLAGENGKSAYELAVANGYQGSEKEWLSSLVGEAGENGKSAYELAVAKGYKGTEQQWLASLAGTAGKDGKDGRSAYEVAVQNGYKGTVNDWLKSLVGAAGKDGANGTNGKDGKDGVDGKNGQKGRNGLSAYELAVANGYMGTLDEWLESLRADSNGQDGKDGKSTYELAVENGFEGTLAEWLESLNGKDGSNGKSAYELAVEKGYTGTEEQWLASLIGEKGADGKDGVNGKDGLNGLSAYEIAVANGYNGTLQDWLVSLVGKDGSNGEDGKSAYDLAVENGYQGSLAEWLVSLAGKDGAAGKDGKDGSNGKSAYELAVEKGYTGTEEQWLASLIGEKGADGKDGVNGKDGLNGLSAYEIAVANGYNGTLQDWLAGLVGKDGSNGEDGKSAYDLAVENGYQGSLAEWLVSLAGKDGAAGKDGLNGKSAYELAVEKGYTGTEEQWLASLVGEKGVDGKDGTNGKSAYEIAIENGYQGTEAEWIDSLNGVAGVGVANAYVNSDKHLIIILTNGTEIDAGYVGVESGDPPATTYTVTFKNHDGSVLKIERVEEGKDATPPADPIREGYTFNGWSGVYTNITADTIITATYTENAVETFTVTFKDYNGSVLKTENVEKGKDAIPPANPIREGYTFNGWSGVYTNVTADTIITATYIKNTVETFTVTFEDYNGTVLKTETVEKGKDATPPADPNRDGYTFTGWSGVYTNITANTTITATYSQNSSNSHTVTFNNYDGSVLKTQNVLTGDNATPPTPPVKNGATFFGWSGRYVNVQQDSVVTAIFSDDKNVIQVTNASGNIGDTVTVMVDIDGVVKTCGFDFDIIYDPALELISYDADLDLDIVVNANAITNGIKLNFSSATDKTKQRDIIELTFKIRDTSKAYLPINISMNSIKEVNDSTLVDSMYSIIGGLVAVPSNA
ncbi:MAG TPA: hypothetical protein GXZ23_03640 [Clostridiales bacterium]|nr:hypothetical protein [Clostridiales bacterium]